MADLLRTLTEAFLTNDHSQTTADALRELLDPAPDETVTELAPFPGKGGNK
jgi:hypothetical protein